MEGIKSIEDFLSSSFQFHSIYYTSQFADKIQNVAANIKLFEVNNVEIDKISTLQTPQGILALVYIPETELPLRTAYSKTFTLVLDDVQDPGNFGTIVRTADWFGIRRIICSIESVDAFNPKAVQASMGSLSRVEIYYTDLVSFLSTQTLQVFGAFLEGENIYTADTGMEGFLVLGNEGNGISAEVKKLVTNKLTIPGNGATESLNVAISAAIFCSELYRKSTPSKFS